MKKMTLLFVAFVFATTGFVSAQSQIQIETIYKSTFGPLKAIHFYNDDLGVIAEEHYIRMTTDGGDTWRHKFIFGLNPVGCGISVQGSDTLIVVAERENQRVHYFHGFRSSPIELYSFKQGPIINDYTITFNNSTVYIAGKFVDTTVIDSSTNRFEPAYFVSSDHGHTWQLKTEVNKPFNYFFISGIHNRGGDTTAVTWSTLNSHGTFLYTNNMQSPLTWGTNLRGKVIGCFDNRCLLSYRTNEIKIQNGPSTNDNKTLFSNLRPYIENARPIALYAKDEVMFVYGGSSVVSPFSSELRVYNYNYANMGGSLISDSSSYGYDLLDWAYGFSRISLTENYVYFTNPPYVVKVNRHQLDDKELISQSQEIEIGYNNGGTSVRIFGLHPQRDYAANLYTMNGRMVKDVGDQLDYNNNEIDLHELPSGAYILSIKQAGSSDRFMRKVMSF